MAPIYSKFWTASHGYHGNLKEKFKEEFSKQTKFLEPEISCESGRQLGVYRKPYYGEDKVMYGETIVNRARDRHPSKQVHGLGLGKFCIVVCKIVNIN